MNSLVTPVWRASNRTCRVYYRLRVILLVWHHNPSHSSVKGDSTYKDFIPRIDGIEKTFVAEVNNGELAVAEDIMVEPSTPPVTTSIRNKRMVRSRGSLEMEANAARMSREESLQRYSSESKASLKKSLKIPSSWYGRHNFRLNPLPSCFTERFRSF